MEKLPDEILLKIFGYLNVITKLICGLVSKRFKLLSDESLGRDTLLDFNECQLLSIPYDSTTSQGNADPVTCLRAMIRKCPKIDQLILMLRHSDKDPSLLLDPIRAWRRLTKLILTLDDDETASRYYVCNNFLELTSITWFELSIFTRSNYGQAFDARGATLLKSISMWTNLHHFALSISHFYITLEFAVNLMTSLPNTVTHFRLDCIIITGWPSKFDDVLEAFIQTHPNLRNFELNIRLTSNSSYDLSRATKNLQKFCPNLKEIGFGQHRTTTQASNNDLSAFDQLEFLKFNHMYRNLTDSDLTMIHSVANRLTTLSLNARIFTVVPPTLHGPLPLLKKLHIFCHYVSTTTEESNSSSIKDAERFFAMLPNLRSISVPSVLFYYQFLKFPISRCRSLNEITYSAVIADPAKIKDVLKCLRAIDKTMTEQQKADDDDNHVFREKICIQLKMSYLYFTSITKSLRSHPIDNVYVVNCVK